MRAHPAHPPPAPLPASLPSYALYGEAGRTQATEALHCESIAERSRRHDWEIRPHRHAALFQILHIASGQAQALLGGRTQALAGPCVLWVPPLEPHGFRFAPTVDGTVLTVLDQHLGRLLAGAPTLASRLQAPGVLAWTAGDAADDAAAAGVARAVAALAAEFHAAEPWRDLALDAALTRLLLAIGRAAPALADEPAAGGARAQAHVQRFRRLVDQRFRQQPPLTALAADLGITPTQLNRVCRQVLGHSALGVLHARLVLEAQRDLAYTTQSVKQIALALGFADAAWFTRFFRRETGQTPTAWRARSAR